MPRTSNQSFEDIRKEFPIFDQKVHACPLIYLDTAATAHKPKAVIDAISDFYSNRYATVNRAVYSLSAKATSNYEGVRKKVLDFLGAGGSYEAIFTSGTTESINLVSQSFVHEFLNPEDEVILFSSEHHSNLVPWQMAQKRYGINLTILPLMPSGDIDLPQFEKALSSKTKLVAFAHISNVTGAMHPAKKICTLCQSKGIYALIDGAQSAGHIPIDLVDIGCDFFTFSSHKLYGPTGVGVLVGKKELLEKMPPLFGGGDMIEKVSFDSTTYAAAPQKFEAGTPKIAQVIGLGAAIDFLQEVGLSNIEAHEKELLKYLLKGLQTIPGINIIGAPNERSSLVSFTLDKLHSLDLATLLDLKGIAIRSGHLCAEPFLESIGHSRVARISLGVYSSKSDIETALSAIRELSS